MTVKQSISSKKKAKGQLWIALTLGKSQINKTDTNFENLIPGKTTLHGTQKLLRCPNKKKLVQVDA